MDREDASRTPARTHSCSPRPSMRPWSAGRPRRRDRRRRRLRRPRPGRSLLARTWQHGSPAAGRARNAGQRNSPPRVHLRDLGGGGAGDCRWCRERHQERRRRTRARVSVVSDTARGGRDRCDVRASRRHDRPLAARLHLSRPDSRRRHGTGRDSTGGARGLGLAFARRTKHAPLQRAIAHDRDAALGHLDPVGSRRDPPRSGPPHRDPRTGWGAVAVDVPASRPRPMGPRWKASPSGSIARSSRRAPTASPSEQSTRRATRRMSPSPARTWSPRRSSTADARSPALTAAPPALPFRTARSRRRATMDPSSAPPLAAYRVEAGSPGPRGIISQSGRRRLRPGLPSWLDLIMKRPWLRHAAARRRHRRRTRPQASRAGVPLSPAPAVLPNPGFSHFISLNR